MRVRTSLILVVVYGVVVLLILVLGFMFFACQGASGCWTFWKCIGSPSISRVKAPPPDAAPREIVRTYFAALKGHDKRVGRLLWDQSSPQFHAVFAGPGSPFTDWTSIEDVDIGEAEVEECGDIGRCVRIPVSYTFQQCNFYTNDDGDWSERFFLDRIDGRWLITGYGQG